MNTIKIENLAMDTALDNTAMDSVVGGWGIGKHFARKVRSVARGVKRVSRTVRSTSRKLIRNRARSGGAKFVSSVLGSTAPGLYLNAWLFS